MLVDVKMANNNMPLKKLFKTLGEFAVDYGYIRAISHKTTSIKVR